MGSRTWIKIYCDKWLNGTIREETAELRGVWVDLLVLAGSSRYGSDGDIKITDRAGFLDQQLADLLRISVQKWVTCKKKLVETDRVEVLENNIIRIKNWGKYQSEYRRQTPYRQPDIRSGVDQNDVTKSYNQKLQQEVTGQAVTKSTALEPRLETLDRRLENRDRDTPLNPPVSQSLPSKEVKESILSIESVINAYQDNILVGGTVSEQMEEELKGACRRYTPAWVADAIKEALLQNQPTWRYIMGILQNWSLEGHCKATRE